jgi:aminoglycoside 6'-N-acetyltransferase-1b
MVPAGQRGRACLCVRCATSHERDSGSCTTITFRALHETDFALLANWLSRPHVLEWWGGDDPAPDIEDIRKKYKPRMKDASSVKPCIAMLAGKPIGFIQSYVALGCGGGWWEEETDPGVRGIDQFLCDGDMLGRGLGSRMVAAFVHKLFEDPRVTKVQTDPDPDNVRAIRCYEKAGFRLVGKITTPDGPALLMVVDRLARPTSIRDESLSVESA